MSSSSCLSFYFRKVVSSCSSCTEPYALSHSDSSLPHLSCKEVQSCTRQQYTTWGFGDSQPQSSCAFRHGPLARPIFSPIGPLSVLCRLAARSLCARMILFYHTKSARPLKCRKELWRNKSRCRPANRRYRTGTRRHQESYRRRIEVYLEFCPSQRTRVSGRNGTSLLFSERWFS
jgi:hypothetical protein